jgi:hypothetical protein
MGQINIFGAARIILSTGGKVDLYGKRRSPWVFRSGRKSGTDPPAQVIGERKQAFR